MILTIFPDIDVIGFKMGIPYQHMLGHRGITHSIPFAILISGIISLFFCRTFNEKIFPIWIYLFICTASHGIFDAFTDGGLGIAFFAPFSNERYFFPIRPIEVSSLTISHFFSEHGISVLKSEFLFLWIPCLLLWVINHLLVRARKRIDST